MFAKYGTKRSAVTLAKGVPLVGGVVGGSVDAVSTRAVGHSRRERSPPAQREIFPE